MILHVSFSKISKYSYLQTVVAFLFVSLFTIFLTREKLDAKFPKVEVSLPLPVTSC